MLNSLQLAFIAITKKHKSADVLAYAHKLVSANSKQVNGSKVQVETDGACEDEHAGECGTCRDDVFFPCSGLENE